MTDITIPPEAVEAAARAVHDIDRKIVGYDEYPPWEELSPRDQRWRTHRALAAIRAALAAWPGMGPICTDQPIGDWCDKLPAIILPLPQENANAEV